MRRLTGMALRGSWFRGRRRLEQATGPNGVLVRFISPGGAMGPVRFLDASTQQVSAPVFDKTGTATVAYTATKVYAVRFTSKHVASQRSSFVPPQGPTTARPGWPTTATGTHSCLPRRTSPLKPASTSIWWSASGPRRPSRQGGHGRYLCFDVYGRHVSATKGTFGRLIKFTTDGAYASIAVDKAGKSGVIWERSSLGSLIQARFGS